MTVGKDTRGGKGHKAMEGGGRSQQRNSALSVPLIPAVSHSQDTGCVSAAQGGGGLRKSRRHGGSAKHSPFFTSQLQIARHWALVWQRARPKIPRSPGTPKEG